MLRFKRRRLPCKAKIMCGRATEAAEWIADLLQHGLLKASFIPDREQRELLERTGALAVVNIAMFVIMNI